MAGGDSDLGKMLIDAAKRQQESVEANAIDFQFPDWRQVAPNDYGQCLEPNLALARYPYETDLAITQLQRELKHDRIQALCHEAVIFDEGKSYRLPYAVLHSWHWWQQMPRADDDFWQTGYLEISVPKKVGGYGFEARGTVRYFGVRFWPDGLPGGADNPLTSSKPQERAEAQAPLPKAEAERISKAIIEIWTNSVTEARAVELARGMCPDHKVSRDPFLQTFRAIRGHKNPGKATSNGK